MEPVKQWSVSSLWRVPTASGTAYLKATPAFPLFADEGGVTQLLARHFPGRVPAVIARNAARGWLLLETFADPAVAWDAASRRRVARDHAILQLEALPLGEALLGAGAVDRRAEVFAGQLGPLLFEAEERALLGPRERALLPELLPLLRVQLDALSSLGLPATLVHGDMHLGNVALGDGGTLFYDWSDAALAHPFFDLFTLLGYPDDPLDGRHAALTRAYLEPWQKVAPLPRLWRASELALTLAPAYHAISYQRICEHQEPGARWELGGATARWLGSLLRLLEVGAA